MHAVVGDIDVLYESSGYCGRVSAMNIQLASM